MSDSDNVPDELQDRDQWLLWDASNDTPRRPHWRGDFKISWSDPDQWHSFDEALAAADEVASWGIGYVTAAENPDYARGLYGVIDIDGGADAEDHPKDWVPSLQPFFDHEAYIEWSPSHHEPGDSGIHIPIVGLDIPEWWNDCQRGDHEGVDVLAHKFCTFTGDTLRGSDTNEVAEYGEWVDDWLHEAHTVIKGEDPTNERDTDLSEVTNEHSGSVDKEWLTEEVAEDALDAIKADVTYTAWKDIGMALVNHFGKTTGGSLFKSWSRNGSKWDNDAEKQADKIIRDAGNYGFGAATIIHHAKQGGWSASDAARSVLSKRSDGGTAVQSGSDTGGPQTPEGPSGGQQNDWYLHPSCIIRKAILDPYHPLDYDENGNVDGSIRDIRGSEKAHYVWQLAKETGHDDAFALFKGPIYSYDDGVWGDDDRQHLREVAERSLTSAYSRGVLDEVEERVRVDDVKETEDLGAPDGTIATEGGLLDLRSRETEPLRPDHWATSRIPVEPGAGAECPRWMSFLDESIDDAEHRKKFQEYAGYCLWHHEQPFGKALFLVGPTDSGKGTALKALRAVIGADNIAAESLRNLIDTRWGPASLVGNLINIRNEVSPRGLQNVEMFKELTGGEDEVDAEFKGEDKFKFTVTQKFLFATNEVPSIKKADEAFYNRLLFVEFPNTVPASEQDKDLLDKLTDERAGILNWMLEGLERLLDQGRFTGELSINGKKEICDAFGGVLDRFSHHCLMVTGNTEDVVVKKDLEELAQRYADQIDKEPEWDSQTGFTRKMANQVGIDQGQKRIDGDNTKVFRGVRVAPETVYELNTEVRALTADTADDRNAGLNEYGVDVRAGYDMRAKSDDEPDSEADDDSEDSEADDDQADSEGDVDDSEGDLVGEPLAPAIVHYVREECRGGDDVPHEDLVEHLADRGAAQKQIDHWIDKCVEGGDIIEPDDGFYRR